LTGKKKRARVGGARQKLKEGCPIQEKSPREHGTFEKFKTVCYDIWYSIIGKKASRPYIRGKVGHSTGREAKIVPLIKKYSCTKGLRRMNRKSRSGGARAGGVPSPKKQI